MANITAKQLEEKISLKLSHNLGLTPEQAGDDAFYKAAALVLMDIMREKDKALRIR